MTLDVEVVVGDPGWRAALPDVERWCAAIVAAAAPFLNLTRPSEVALLLSDDDESRALNARFRGQDKPTNVLSFPALDDGADLPDAPMPAPLGDIAIALGVTRGEAEAYGRPLADHAAHLLVHGLLHLVGYDHAEDGTAQVMEDLERRILATLGIDDPYR